jgi:hypothetical protein
MLHLGYHYKNLRGSVAASFLFVKNTTFLLCRGAMVRFYLWILVIGYGVISLPLFGAMASSPSIKQVKSILRIRPLRKNSGDDTDCAPRLKRQRVRSVSPKEPLVRSRSVIDENSDDNEVKPERHVSFSDEKSEIKIEARPDVEVEQVQAQEIDFKNPTDVCLLIDYRVDENPLLTPQQMVELIEKEIGDRIVGVQNFLEQTVLHVAAMRGLSSVIAVAIAAGIDKDRCDRMHNTALIVAVRGGKHEFVRALLAHKPDDTICDENGYTVLWHAHENNDARMEALLVDYNLNKTDTKQAAS